MKNSSQNLAFVVPSPDESGFGMTTFTRKRMVEIIVPTVEIGRKEGKSRSHFIARNDFSKVVAAENIFQNHHFWQTVCKKAARTSYPTAGSFEKNRRRRIEIFLF